MTESEARAKRDEAVREASRQYTTSITIATHDFLDAEAALENAQHRMKEAGSIWRSLWLYAEQTRVEAIAAAEKEYERDCAGGEAKP